MNVFRPVLVTGATGYVGGRLVPRLLDAGCSVRCLVRESGRLQGRPWSDQVEVIEGDALRPETLPAAMKDVWATYHLIRSLSDTGSNHERDLVGARNFGQAAQEAGVERIICLSTLGSSDLQGSTHSPPQHKVGKALAHAGVPVTEFRTAIIFGSGSLSFDMIRYLTEPMPVLPCPRWVYTHIQPAAINDLLRYLVGALAVPESAGRIIEIGGADVLTYADMMKGYAKLRGLRRILFPVPVLAPRLAAYWSHWMTPVQAGVAYSLIEGLRNDVVVRDGTAKTLFPDIEPVSYDKALQRALKSFEEGPVETHWSDSLASTLGDTHPVELDPGADLQILRRQKVVAARPEDVYAIFSRVGGDQKLLYAHWLWWLRGVVDRLLGGPGFRRSRRDPYEARVGDALDFWRVEAIEPGHMMRLRAEMKLPGEAWLQLEARPQENGRALFVQTAFMAPKGLVGFLYWYGLYPIHCVIFSGMVSDIAERAEAAAGT